MFGLSVKVAIFTLSHRGGFHIINEHESELFHFSKQNVQKVRILDLFFYGYAHTEGPLDPFIHELCHYITYLIAIVSVCVCVLNTDLLKGCLIFCLHQVDEMSSGW